MDSSTVWNPPSAQPAAALVSQVAQSTSAEIRGAERAKLGPRNWVYNNSIIGTILL
jgi:hypothetical protein